MSTKDFKLNWSLPKRCVMLFFVPIVGGLIYILVMKVHQVFRFDLAYFQPSYQTQYSSPGSVAIALEEALRTGDQSLYTELTGLRHTPMIDEPRPDITLSILLDTDERDYFHYLYFDTSTLLRDTQYIKQVKGRWLVVPSDSYYFYDSGHWLGVAAPITLTWWAILLVITFTNIIFQSAARTRDTYGSQFT